MKEGVLIVSPLAFKEFIRKHGFLLDEHHSIDDAARRIQSRLQRQMTMAGHHKKTAKGLNIHSYEVTGANKTSKIRGWLLPRESIYGDLKAPDVNKKLTNLTGFAKEKK